MNERKRAGKQSEQTDPSAESSLERSESTEGELDDHELENVAAGTRDSGAAGGKPELQEIIVTKHLDKDSV